MSDFWSFESIERVTGGAWLVEPSAMSLSVAGLWHDTRQLQRGQAYLAIRGERFDGHRFVGEAFERGAALAIVEDAAGAAGPSPRPGQGENPLLLVDSTVAALQDLASAYRDELARHGCRVIAVCGSNGKTTTRHLIYHVLINCNFRGTQSPKSFNNHLGVPLTLLSADPADDFVVCEMGTNHPGEIAALSEIVWPDAAVVTSIGAEHLEAFKTIEGVAREESAVLPFVRRDGLVVTPAEAAAAMMPHYDVREGVTLLPVKDTASVPARLPFPGEHNRMNAALALAVARWLGADGERAAGALASARPVPGRMQVRRLGGGVTLIDDTYNANPDSVAAALRTLARFDGRRVAVLGEMRELGAASAAAHAEAAAAARAAADEVVLIGEAFGGEPWSDAVPAAVVEMLRPGDVVLLKASRGPRLERIIPAIEARFGSSDGRGRAASLPA